MSTPADAVFFGAWACATPAVFRGLFPQLRDPGGFTADWAWTAGIMAVFCVCFQHWADFAGCAVSLAVALIIRWWNRRRRDRAKQLLGEKSRQIREAIVRKMRDVTIPRPVPAPVPQGA